MKKLILTLGVSAAVLAGGIAAALPAAAATPSTYFHSAPLPLTYFHS